MSVIGSLGHHLDRLEQIQSRQERAAEKIAAQPPGLGHGCSTSGAQHWLAWAHTGPAAGLEDGGDDWAGHMDEALALVAHDLCAHGASDPGTWGALCRLHDLGLRRVAAVARMQGLARIPAGVA